jgi:hypothetical protein
MEKIEILRGVAEEEREDEENEAVNSKEKQISGPIKESLSL